MRILLSSRNPDKAREIRALLPAVDVVTAAELDAYPDVEETGSTLEENALLKARAGWLATGIRTIADDSGLEVDALGGEPGVRSARFAGETCSYADNCRLVLERLAGVENRTARFRCVIAIADGVGERTVEGRVEGTIARDRRGAAGFGYDPVFVPEGEIHTFAEMSAEKKNRISHRARALEALRVWLDMREG